MSTKNTKHRRIDRSKAIYILPNLCTTLSLFSGFSAAMLAMENQFIWSACAILVSLVFDGLDGKVARFTGTVSRFGVEYDSLADVIAFGVAPAILSYMWALESFGRLGYLIAFIYIACGALRLARFNVQVEERGTKNFVGLPIPAAASTVACAILLADQLGHPGPLHFWLIPAMIIVLSFLMVSNIPYLSFKELNLSRLKSFNGLVATVLAIALVAIVPQFMGFVLMAAYVLMGPWVAVVMDRRRKKKMAMRKKIREQEAAVL